MDWNNPYLWLAAFLMSAAFLDKILEHLAKALRALATRVRDLADAWHELQDAFGRFWRRPKPNGSKAR